MNSLKNMLVLKDLPSNLIEEAYVILNPNLKLKMQMIDNKNNNSNNNLDDKKKVENNYILNEAKYVLINYISKFETNAELLDKKDFEKKYKKLKIFTLGILAIFCIYIILTSIF